MKFKLLFSCLILGCFAILDGAIGCQKIIHTPDYWNVSEPQFQDCKCPCRQVSTDRGRCFACGHYGNPDRGEITARVLGVQDNVLE